MSSNASKTSTTSKPRPRPGQFVQRVDGDSKAKLHQINMGFRLAELVRKDATWFLRRKAFENWLLQVEAVTLPLGPSLLPKTVKNIAAWQALTPEQQTDRKAAAIEAARVDADRKRAERREKNVRPNQEG